ncbi:MAG: GntR family transcriptional regulator [Acidobacteriota bacterium]
MSWNVHLRIDPGSGVPVYRQLMNQIRYYVSSGAIATGDRLPSIRDLARGIGVNPTTVVKAYTELENDGFLDRQQGRGVFVADQARGLSSAELDRALRDSARQLVVEATQLGVDIERVVHLVRLEYQRVERESETDRGQRHA